MTLSSRENSQLEGEDFPASKPARSRLRRALRWIVIFCLLIVILTLCAAAYIWTNRYAFMEDIAVDALAEEGIDARLSIQSVSKTRAEIHNIQLSENGAEFFTSETVVIDYDWRDMMKGQARRLVFTRPSGRITVDETGQIIDGWLPHSQNETDTTPSFPPEGIKIDDGALIVQSPFGEISARLDADYFSADNFTADVSLAPGTFSYGDWHIQGGGVFNITLKEALPQIKTDLRLNLLEHPALDAQALYITGDFIPVTHDAGLDITGKADITFAALNTAQIITGPGQLSWDGQINHAKAGADSSRLSFNGDWSADIDALSVPDPIRRRDLAQTLSLSEALGKTPIAQNFAPDLTRQISKLLADSAIKGEGRSELTRGGLSIFLNGPATEKSRDSALTLTPTEAAPFYRYDKAAFEIHLTFHAGLTNPAGFSLHGGKLVARSHNGWRLDGIKAFSADISTRREWHASGIDNIPARLSPFQAKAVYKAGTKRQLTLNGHINYDGALPGGVVTGLKTGGELRLDIVGPETLMAFASQDGAPITLNRVETDTGWRAEDISGRLLTQGAIFRRRETTSKMNAQMADMSFIAIDDSNSRNLGMNFETMDITGDLAGESQTWNLRTQMAKICSEDTPGPGTDIRMPAMDMQMRREPNQDLQFTMTAPLATAKTQLVTATNLAITAQGSPDNFTLNYAPGETSETEIEASTVKFIGDPLPPLPMTGVVSYKDAAFTGAARTNLPFGEDTPIDISYRFQDGAGTAAVDIPELIFTPEGLQPQSLVKALRGKIAEVDGAVSAQIKLAFAAGQPLQSSGTAQLKSLNFGTLPGPLSNVSTQLSFSSFFPLQSQGRQTLSVAKFDPGYPLENGVIEFELIPDGVKVYSARWPLGTGEISLEPFDWLYSAAENRVIMRVDNVSLGEFLNEIGDGAVEATGDIEGMLPIVLSGVDVKVDSGYLRVKDGGTIKYNSEQIDSVADYAQDDNDAVAALREHRYRDAVFQALKEFQYRSLDVKMDGPLDGAIEVGIEFDGSNKDVLNNQPFRFNINIEGELLNILRSFNTNEQIKSELARRQLQRESLSPELE